MLHKEGKPIAACGGGGRRDKTNEDEKDIQKDGQKVKSWAIKLWGARGGAVKTSEKVSSAGLEEE